jgi:hypothetical protein
LRSTPIRAGGRGALDDGCELDFDGRAVVVFGTVTTVAPGGGFGLRSGALTLDGGALRARGAPGSPGAITVVASGPFVMDPSSPLVDADGADGGGVIRVTATALELRAGSTITADGTAGDATGGAVVLTSTGPDPITIAGTVTSQGRGGGDSSGGYVAIEAASLVVH